jgi:hypothetical protein
VTAILGILGPVLKFAVSWFVGMNTKEMVARQTSQNIQVNTDEIRELIHNYHFGATPAVKRAAFEELQRRGAMT